MPALRLGGSLTFSVLIRSVTSTEVRRLHHRQRRFFLAFMMFGSVT